MHLKGQKGLKIKAKIDAGVPNYKLAAKLKPCAKNKKAVNKVEPSFLIVKGELYDYDGTIDFNDTKGLATIFEKYEKSKSK